MLMSSEFKVSFDEIKGPFGVQAAGKKVLDP